MKETVARATARAMGVSAEEIPSPEEDRRARQAERERMLREEEPPF
jgi:hypothetical protein